MSIEYYFRDTNQDRLYDSFNQQIKEIHQMCLDAALSLRVEGDLESLKESFFEDLKSNSLFNLREPDYERFIVGTSTTNHFYWRSDNGFDSVLSVQQFMAKNPHMVLMDEYDRAVSLDRFSKAVGCDQKIQRDDITGDLIRPSTSEQTKRNKAYAEILEDCHHSGIATEYNDFFSWAACEGVDKVADEILAGWGVDGSIKGNKIHELLDSNVQKSNEDLYELLVKTISEDLAQSKGTTSSQKKVDLDKQIQSASVRASRFCSSEKDPAKEPVPEL